MDNDLYFICNNAKGIKSSPKRLKLFEHFKVKLIKLIIFVQETHSSIQDEKQQFDDFQSKLFFSQGKTDSCRVAIGYYGNKSFELKTKQHDTEDRILIIQSLTDDLEFTLINLYNANTEEEQLNVFQVF